MVRIFFHIVSHKSHGMSFLTPVIPQVNEKGKKKHEKAKQGGEHAKKENKKAPKPEKPLFPAEGKVNKYGFIYLSGDILAAFGLTKGAIHKLCINLEGERLIITKA